MNNVGLFGHVFALFDVHFETLESTLFRYALFISSVLSYGVQPLKVFIPFKAMVVQANYTLNKVPSIIGLIELTVAVKVDVCNSGAMLV